MVAALLRENLIAVARAYGRGAGLSLDQVSKKIYGSWNFLRELKAGERSCSIDKLDEMIEKMRKTWPAKAEWPTTRAIIIPRPKLRNH